MRRASQYLRSVALLAIFATLTTTASALDYVALGDSIAVGTGDGGTGGYVGRYRTHAEADLGNVVTLQNLAVGGSTSQQLLATLTGDGSVRAAVAGADLLTLDIGGNDFLIAFFAYKGGTCGGSDGQDCLRQAVAEFALNWQAILSELRALNPSAMMRTMDYYNPFTTDSAAAIAAEYEGDINGAINSMAPAAGIPVAQVQARFNGKRGTEIPNAKGYLDPDGIHPSPLGHAAIAEAFRALGYPPLPGATVLIPSSAFVLKDDVIPPIDSALRRASFTVNTKKTLAAANRVTMPAPGGSQDPRAGGATLTVYNGTGQTSDVVSVVLPPSGWTLAGVGGFRFQGPGPVTSVVLKPDSIKVKAAGATWGYSLDEPSQGAVALRLELGGGTWCAVAPAKTRGFPPSSATTDLPGKFVGQKNAPAPATCPDD